jgi:ribonuclease P protein component
MMDKPRSQTLRKQERLSEKTALDNLFLRGNSISNPPVKLFWDIGNRKSTIPAKVSFGVPKRIFKNAVTRNLLKRRMMEAYRKNKLSKTISGETYNLMFIYTGRKINPYSEIESKIVLTLQHFKTTVGAE